MVKTHLRTIEVNTNTNSTSTNIYLAAVGIFKCLELRYIIEKGAHTKHTLNRYHRYAMLMIRRASTKRERYLQQQLSERCGTTVALHRTVETFGKCW